MRDRDEQPRSIRYLSGLGEAVIVHGNRCACWRCNPSTSLRYARIMERVEQRREDQGKRP